MIYEDNLQRHVVDVQHIYWACDRSIGLRQIYWAWITFTWLGGKAGVKVDAIA